MSGEYSPRPVVIVDDEEQIIKSLERVLIAAGITSLLTLSDSREVLRILEEVTPAVVLLDLTMPHLSGRELLTQVRDMYPDLPVIIVTGNTEISTAVECMKNGAFDYLVKPVESNKLVATVMQAVEIQDLRTENQFLRDRLVSNRLENPGAFTDIKTQSDMMHSLFLYIEAIAGTFQTVLITGETGVGKELVAQALHSLSRRPGSMVSVSVAGLDDSVFSDTLFGHKKGAFTGADQVRKGLIETASEGTLFLDEIGDLTQTSQVKLLRLLEKREYRQLGSDITKKTSSRIVVATNRDIAASAEAGEFRKDLYYRLRTHHVRIPPLRSRSEDIPLLLEHFLREAAGEFGFSIPGVPAQLPALLKDYNFPGNVRELQGMVFDAMSRFRIDGRSKGMLPLAAFRDAIGEGPSIVSPPEVFRNAGRFPSVLPTIKDAVDELVDEALRRSGGRQREAADILGISQQALSKRLKNRTKNGSSKDS